MVRQRKRNQFGEYCRKYGARDTISNAMIAGVAGLAGGVVGTAVGAKYVGTKVKNDLETKTCKQWSDFVYPEYANIPLGQFEKIKQSLIRTLTNISMPNDADVAREISVNMLSDVSLLENLLYSVPIYENSGIIPWSVYKNPPNKSGQLCNERLYNLKHNLIELKNGSGKYLRNLNPVNAIIPFNTDGYLLDASKSYFNARNNAGIIRFDPTRLSARFGYGGSIVPFAGGDGIGGAYAQPSFGFGKKRRKRVVKRKRRKRVVKRKRVIVVKKKPKPVAKLTKTLKNQAKKVGVKLTVKRNGKRVYKSKQVLKKQIKNKLKAKSKRK